MITPSLRADCDWHVHTTLSDGIAEPDEALRLAAAQGLRSVAITDHDCLDAHLDDRLGALATQLAVQLVVGAEIDCSIDRQETEILAYHFDPRHADLARCLREVQAQRWERFRFYCHGMAAKGHPIDAEAVIQCGTKVPIKVHLYRALEAAGVYRHEAYKQFKAELDDLGAAPPVSKPALEEVVDLVRSAGGVAVLAHPLYYRHDVGLEKLLRRGAAVGCSGVELSYPYCSGVKGMPAAEARQGLLELVRLTARFFPGQALLTRGTDMHFPAEWQGRLEELASWESASGINLTSKA